MSRKRVSAAPPTAPPASKMADTSAAKKMRQSSLLDMWLDTGQRRQPTTSTSSRTTSPVTTTAAPAPTTSAPTTTAAAAAMADSSQRNGSVPGSSSPMSCDHSTANENDSITMDESHTSGDGGSGGGGSGAGGGGHSISDWATQESVSESTAPLEYPLSQSGQSTLSTENSIEVSGDFYESMPQEEEEEDDDDRIQTDSPASISPSSSQIDRLPKCTDNIIDLPVLASTNSHTVMFGPRSTTNTCGDNKSIVWLPSSRHSKLSPAPGSDRPRLRWNVIKQSLSRPIHNIHDLQTAISAYQSSPVTMKGLQPYLSDSGRRTFFFSTLKKIIALALRLPDVCHKRIPLLRQQKGHSLTFSQCQVAVLLANAFLMTFQRPRGHYVSYPEINFTRMFNSAVKDDRAAKLDCFLHYFHQVSVNMPDGNVTYTRLVENEVTDWSIDCITGALPSYLVSTNGLIEKEGEAMLQVDFANRFIGGGVLGHGSVQEEIRFCISPELVLSLMFCQSLQDNEAIVIAGSETFCKYKGYSRSFRFLGGYNDITPRDAWKRRYTHVVAIDALRITTHRLQFNESHLKRELNKAHVGYSHCDFIDNKCTVATGNWGCGAFGGDLRLKAFVQILVCAKLRRPIYYFTFKDHALKEEITSFCEFLSDLGNVFSIGLCYKAALRYGQCSDTEKTLHNNSVLSYVMANYTTGDWGDSDSDQDILSAE